MTQLLKKSAKDKYLSKIAETNLKYDAISLSTRARGVTIGTGFGGSVEINMRRSDGTNTWAILQPVEAIELLHQLAASVGCHLHLQPRKDFSSWREWKHTDEELAHYRGNYSISGSGHPPHAKYEDKDAAIGSTLPPPEQQPGMKIDRSNEHVVATEKTVNRRSAKRTSKTP